MDQNAIAVMDLVGQNAEGTGPATSSNGTSTEKRISGAERRELCRARHARLVAATFSGRNSDRDERASLGITGREGYVAWSFERMEEIRAALNGTTVNVTLTRTGAVTKAGPKVAVTAVANVLRANGMHEAVALKGETTWRGVDAPDGLSLDVKLTRAMSRKGEPLTIFEAVAGGTLKVRLNTTRHVRVIASAL